MQTEVKRQKTGKDPYVMTDEKLVHAIASKLPTPFGEEFERVQEMSRTELIREWLRYYDTTALDPAVPGAEEL